MRILRLVPVLAIAAAPFVTAPPAAADCLTYTGSPSFAVCTNEGYCWASAQAGALVNWCLQRPPR